MIVTTSKRTDPGFSLMELIIAMAITLSVMSMATTLIAGALRIRSRENQKSDALADVQRAMNMMSREVANSGFNLNNNGIVASESDGTRLRIRANLNRYDYNATTNSRDNIVDEGEDVSYFINLAEGTKYLARHDLYGGTKTVLANRLDSFNIHYYADKVTYDANPGADDITNVSAAPVNPSEAKYIVIAVSVTLDPQGTPGSTGYQAPFSVLLCSDVALRNSSLWTY